MRGYGFLISKSWSRIMIASLGKVHASGDHVQLQRKASVPQPLGEELFTIFVHYTANFLITLSSIA
jgi:hypothetical protein